MAGWVQTHRYVFQYLDEFGVAGNDPHSPSGHSHSTLIHSGLNIVIYGSSVDNSAEEECAGCYRDPQYRQAFLGYLLKQNSGSGVVVP